MREKEKERKRGKQHPFFTPTQRIVARRLPMHTYRKRKTRSSIQGDSERREVGAPTLRKRRLKPDVSAGLRAGLRLEQHVPAASNCTLFLATMLRGVAAENLPRCAADAARNYFLFFHQLYNTAR